MPNSFILTNSVELMNFSAWVYIYKLGTSYDNLSMQFKDRNLLQNHSHKEVHIGGVDVHLFAEHSPIH